MIGERTSRISRRVRSRGVSRAMRVVQQIRSGLLIPQRTIGHQLSKAKARHTSLSLTRRVFWRN